MTDTTDENGAGRLTGMSMRTAARLESWGVPDKGIATKAFVEAFKEFDTGANNAAKFTSLTKLSDVKIPRVGKEFNLKKPDGNDPDTLKELFYFAL